MTLLDHVPDGGLEDEDQEDEEASDHVQAADDPQKNLKRGKYFLSVKIRLICFRKYVFKSFKDILLRFDSRF